jgi:hypothetical protein
MASLHTLTACLKEHLHLHGRRYKPHSPGNHGEGFDPIRTMRNCYQLLAVLDMMCDYAIVVDDFSEGRVFTTASVLIDHRNLTQHRLMSLPGAPLYQRTAKL